MFGKRPFNLKYEFFYALNIRLALAFLDVKAVFTFPFKNYLCEKKKLV